MSVTTLTKKDFSALEKKGQLTPEMEQFCVAYATFHFGHGVKAYAHAYGHEIDFDVLKYGDGKKREVERKKYMVCGSAASRLLKNVKILQRIHEVNEENITEGKVGFEVSRMMLQNKDYSSKLRAIELWYKLKGKLGDSQDKLLVLGLIKHVYENASEINKPKDQTHEIPELVN